jgi:hypothetical protein
VGGRHSRNKGKAGEREVVRIFRESLGMDTRRGWQAASGTTACDCEGTPWWVEVKRGRVVRLRAAYAQAKADTDGRPPVVVWRDDRGPWMVLLALEDFTEEVKRWQSESS